MVNSDFLNLWNYTWRDNLLDGVPASGVNPPDKTYLRAQLGVALDSALSQAITGGTRDRGVFDPAVSSGTTGYPTTGGSGVGGAILKGDSYTASKAGYIRTVAIVGGDIVYAKIDNPGQTAANWNYVNRAYSYTPENAANKITSLAGTPTNSQYLGAAALKTELTATNASVSAVDTRTRGIGQFEAFYLNGRACQALKMSYDLQPVEYMYLDTGETVSKATVSSDARYTNLPPMLYNGRWIRIKTLSYDFSAIEFEYLDTSQQVAVGSGVNAAAMRVVQTNGQLRIFMPTKGRFTEVVFANDVIAAAGTWAPATNCNIWHIRDAWDTLLTGYTPSRIQKILRGDGEVEVAVKVQGDADFVGGSTHGNQVKSAFMLWADGTIQDTTQTVNYNALSIRAVQKSVLYRYGSNTTKLADLWTEWEFAPGKIRIQVTVKWAQANTMSRTYLSGILPCYRSVGAGPASDGGSVNIVTKGRRSPFFEEEDLPSSATPAVESDAAILEGYGSGGYLVRVEKTKGWTYAGRSSRFDPAVNNKLYQDVYGNGVAVTLNQQDTFETVITLENPN